LVANLTTLYSPLLASFFSSAFAIECAALPPASASPVPRSTELSSSLPHDITGFRHLP
jgi:hypothetical protein